MAKSRYVRSSFPPAAGSSNMNQEKFPLMITRSCGHDEEIMVYSETGKYIDGQRLRQCTNCYRDAAANADAAAVRAKRRAELEGSEKQTGWATGIRQRRAEAFAKIVTEVTDLGKTLVSKRVIDSDQMNEAITDVKEALTDLMLGRIEWEGEKDVLTSGQSKWWIETRMMPERELLATIIPDREIGAGPSWEGLFRKSKAPSPSKVAAADDDYDLDAMPF